MRLDDLFGLTPFCLERDVKKKVLMENLTTLTVYHERSCEPYRNILSALGFEYSSLNDISDFPYLPVRLFKDYELKSVADKDIIRTLTSSGTTFQKVSRIFLDRQTSLYQTKALVNIMQDFLGKKRLPMIIADSITVIKDRQSFSARGAGILGMSNFGRDHFYLLDENMEMDEDGLADFLARHSGKEILIFGFTFMIWQYVYKRLLTLGRSVDFGRSILIHTGGWKKLVDEAVNNETFKRSLRDLCGIRRIYNFYGMVEQVGSVFMECESGCFHAPNFADVVIRDPLNWRDLPPGREGVIEALSVLPRSYPGHILLTEDMGEIVGEDDCPCGRCGKYFTVKGRIPEAELRGCSDTHAFEGA